MNSTSVRRGIVPGIAALTLALSACGAGNETTNTAATDDSSLSGTLAGGGASTQQAAMGAWAVGFQTKNPGVTVEYDPVGSGGGRENFISGAFPFAGSDSYLDNDESELDDAAERCGGTVLEVPSYVSPIAIIFKVEGVDKLQLSPETLAGIFAGKITKWDDPAIAADNPDADLPSANINAVHRSDESGTTGNFTDYLDAVAPDVWDVGSIELWPEEYGGSGGKGTSGVVSAVVNGQNSIGYADASQAGDLGVASIGVGEEFVDPSPEAAAKILEASAQAETATENQLVFDLDFATEESGTYPIVLTSYLMACQSYDDAETGELTKAFLSYVISDEGQQQAAAEAGSAPISPSLQEQSTAIIDTIG